MSPAFLQKTTDLFQKRYRQAHFNVSVLISRLLETRSLVFIIACGFFVLLFMSTLTSVQVLNLKIGSYQFTTRQVNPRVYLDKDNYLIPPPPPGTRISGLNFSPSADQSIERENGHNWNIATNYAWKHLLNEKPHGFFVEAGGREGGSGTQWLEVEYHWEGLLVEPYPKNLKKLLTKNRKCWIAPLCLSPTGKTESLTNYRETMSIIREFYLEESNPPTDSAQIPMRCFPLVDLLKAINRNHVDLLILDVEGAELEVLKTFPFKQVPIQAIIVNATNQPQEVASFLKAIGFQIVRLFETASGKDALFNFVKKSELVENRSRYLKDLLERYLIPPAPPGTPFSPSAGATIAKQNDPKWEYNIVSRYALTQLSHNKTKGFFVEAGANDGELRSHSLDLEMNFQWVGLLVEPHPMNLKQLVTKNRKSWIAKGCLSPSGKFENLTLEGYNSDTELTHIPQFYHNMAVVPRDARQFEVQCFPLADLLLAISRTHVDLLILDVEGAELEILRTFPFHKISIQVIAVERNHEGHLYAFLESVGYEMVETLDKGGVRDAIFNFVGVQNVTKRIVG